MYRLDEGASMSRVDLRRDAVPQVEHVAWAVAEACQRHLHLAADGIELSGWQLHGGNGNEFPRTRVIGIPAS